VWKFSKKCSIIFYDMKTSELMLHGPRIEKKEHKYEEYIIFKACI
jgi:hypothetical protein